MSSFTQDVRLAFRNLAQRPGVAAVIVLSLGLALAGNTVLFSVVEALILRPLPFAQPDRLALLWGWDRNLPGRQGLRPLSASSFLEIEGHSRTFAQVAAMRGRSFNLGGSELPEEITALSVTPAYFDVLGVSPDQGRGFTKAEGIPGGEQVVVLSHELWQRRFAGRPGLLGTTLTLDDEPFTVVGILPEGAASLAAGIQLYVPLPLDPIAAETGSGSLFVVGRLAPGVELAAAKQELATLGEQLASEPSAARRGLGWIAFGLRQQFPGPSDRVLWGFLQALMLMVLLIACLNVANLLLARSEERRHEAALRTALGARRRDLVRQLFTESGLLALAGGLLGLGLAAWGGELAAEQLASRLPTWMRPALNLQVGLFTFALSASAGLFIGLLPSLRMTRPNLVAGLKEGGREASAGSGRRRLASAMVVLQMAVSLVLLSATGVLVRGIGAVAKAAPGFDESNLTVFRLTLPERRYPASPELASLVSRLETALEAIPGVEGVVAANTLPRSRTNPSATFVVEGREAALDSQPPAATWIAISPRYFTTLGIALRSGRAFDEHDAGGRAGVAVVSRGWAERFLGSEDPLGRHIIAGGERREIVGVVGDVLQNRLFLDQGHSPTVYVPFAQAPDRSVYFLVRARTELAGDLGGVLRAGVAALDPALPVSGLKTFAAHLDDQFLTERLISSFVSAFSLFGLLLSALGVYGIVSFAVAQRTREIGIRMAIGARRSEILNGVLRQGMLMAAAGLAVGLLPCYLANGLLGATFSSMVPSVPQLPTLAAVVFVLSFVTLVASLLPAKRAADLDPIAALRRDS